MVNNEKSKRLASFGGVLHINGWHSLDDVECFMIEDLKNTYVVISNKKEEKVAISLYGAAGFKLGGWLRYGGDCILVHEDRAYKAFVNNAQFCGMPITLEELAFQYGLAPQWANRIFIGENSDKVFWASDNSDCIELVVGSYSFTCPPEIQSKPIVEKWDPDRMVVGKKVKQRFKGKLFSVFIGKGGEEFIDISENIKPIKSKKDIVIEMAKNELKDQCYPPSILDCLYEKGMLKKP